MFEEARNNISNTTRRGLALYFGAINLAGETITNPGKVFRGVERRGEKVLDRIDNNNKQIRRSVTLLQKRTSETASSVRGTARATVGLATTMADDVTATAPTTRKRATSKTRSTSKRRSTSSRGRVAAAGRSVTGATSTRSTSTRSSSTTSSGSRSQTAVAKQRSQAAQKAARTRALNEKKAELKKARTVARAKATRAKNESKTTLDKAADSVQHGFQVVGERLENVGERIERSVEQVAS